MHTGAQVPRSGSIVPSVPPLGAAIPIVVPLADNRNLMIGNRIETRAPSEFQLDGLVSQQNLFNNPSGTVFRYGGGAFNMSNSLFVGPVSFEFEGAAANTFALLDAVGLINHSPATTPDTSALPTPAQRNKPKKITTRLAAPLSGDISSQYDGKQ
jgi:hypothetical protein